MIHIVHEVLIPMNVAQKDGELRPIYVKLTNNAREPLEIRYQCSGNRVHHSYYEDHAMDYIKRKAQDALRMVYLAHQTPVEPIIPGQPNPCGESILDPRFTEHLERVKREWTNG